MPALGLELDKLLGDLVVGALGEDAQHGEACVVQVHPRAQRHPAGAAALLDDVAQLHERDADQPVLAREAVVLDAELQLVRVRVVLVAQVAEGWWRFVVLAGYFME